MRWFLRGLIIFLTFFPLIRRSAASELDHPEDAALRSAFFIDRKEGWVVGDAGVILHTLDGGATWQQQETGLSSAGRVSLRCVHFLTPLVGWVVGRQELTHDHSSVGVVLFTSDGGLEWKQQLANQLPGLNHVRFVDLKNGYLLGDGSDQFPSGVFKTGDSGKSWAPLPGPRTTSWLSGDFFDGQNGILVGAWSRLGTVRANKCTVKEFGNSLDSRDVTSVQILAKKALAAGQGGLILTSESGGSKWGAEAKWPTEVLANLDFHAVSAVKDHVWIAGRPGSVVMHSADAGATWNICKTGQSLPLNGIYFFDNKTGWAVGDAGTILATQDGGKTWATQHQAAKRIAGLCIHTHNEDAPVDTLARLGAAQGYLMGSLRITAPDAASIARGRSHDARRYAAAARQAGALGGESLWHFPLPQYLEGCDKKTILAHWNQFHAGDAEKELLRQLVLTLRIWRPSVVFTTLPDSKSPLAALLGEAVREAVKRAAEPGEFPEQISQLGLQVWQVRHVHGVSEGKEGALTQDNDEPSVRLRATIRQFAAEAQTLFSETPTPLPKKRSYQPMSIGEKVAPARQWMEGVEHVAGETMRGGSLTDQADEKALQAIAQRRGVLDLAEHEGDPGRTLAMVPIMLDKLPDADAAPTAYAVASRFAQRGQWYLAQEVYLYMVERYPYHPLSAQAYRWLIRLNTSSEARRRNDLKHFAVAAPLGLAKKNAGGLEKNPIQQIANREPGLEPLLNGEQVRMWNKGSLELKQRLNGFGPVYAFDPATQFCLQSARRRLGEVGAARAWFTDFCKYVPSGPWYEAARAELWLNSQADAPPRRPGRCRYTEVRPHLDGKFDDPCWQGGVPMMLDDAVGATTKGYHTEAQFAYDAEFLYVALKCTHPAGQRVPPVSPRLPDADLDAYDRVSILLDLDRDYTTYYHLEVDQRGCVRDSCWGDRRWSPRWFVAVHSTDAGWNIEAAIPLGELTGERIAPDAAWAFNVVRILPGRGVQSWSQPADVRPCPEGMSVLMFQPGAARPMEGAR